MAELTSLKNIGKEMDKKLKCIDICSAEELARVGSKEAFLRLKMRFSNVCLVHLYILQGAIDNIHYNQLSNQTKEDLKCFCDELKNNMSTIIK